MEGYHTCNTSELEELREKVRDLEREKYIMRDEIRQLQSEILALRNEIASIPRITDRGHFL
jgi:predicted RNase H-like nuclease (RuvC/YqgF family)